MRMLVLSLTVTAAAALSACSREVKVSENEARTLAASALERYCLDEKLPLKAFRVTEVTGPAGSAQWLIVYESTGIRPTQQVAVGIMKTGAVEVSTDFDGRDGQPLRGP